MLLAVSYHYVAERSPAGPRAIFPVTVEQLTEQVELLARDYELVSRDDLLAAVDGGRTLPERACVLTFDDGLRCQAELSLPVLERAGAPAIFFVCGAPLAERRALAVHKLHAVREALDEEAFAVRVQAALAARGTEAPEVSTAEASAHYRYDTEAVARVKFLLNMALTPAVRDEVVDELFAAEIGDEGAFADELYMSRDDVAELEAAHRAVGAHSYEHLPLARMDGAAAERDLARGAEVLAEVTGTAPQALSYPYGTDSTVDDATARRALAAGYRVAFTSRRGVNETLDEPLLLARLDATEAPGGSRA